ncbi:lipopolysaccharide biosynthesis protein [Geodermatophilus sp. SYSU D00815]
MSSAPESTAEAQAPGDRGLLGRLLRGSSWEAAAQIMPLVVNIVMTPLIIAGLGIDRYGLYLLVLVIAQVLSAADGGFGGAALRYFSVYAGEGDRVRLTRLLTTAVLLVAAVGTAAFGAFFWAAPHVLRLLQIPDELLGEGTFLLRALILITAMSQLRNLFAAVLNAHGRFALTSITNNLGYVVYIVGVVLTVRHDWGLYGIGVTLVVQQVLATFVIVPASLRHLDLRSVGLTPWAQLKPFLRYALHTQWADIMLLLTLQTDAIVVGAFLPVRQVAYYSTGANFALQLRQVPLNALIPMQSTLGQSVGAKGPDGARADFERLQRLWVVGTTGWGAVAVAAAWFGITAWLGHDFAISGVVAVVMLLAYQVTLWADVLTVWTQALERPELPARCATVAVVVNLVLTLVLVHPFGILGTVAATAVSQIVASFLLLRLARRKLPGTTRSFLREIPVLPALAAAALVLALELLFRPLVPQGPLGLVLSGLVAAPGLALYALLAFGPARSLAFVRDRFRRQETTGGVA